MDAQCVQGPRDHETEGEKISERPEANLETDEKGATKDAGASIRPAAGDPTDTDHPTGEKQAAENAERELPG